MRRLIATAMLTLAAVPLAGCVTVARQPSEPAQVVIQRESAPIPAPGTTTYITPGQASSTVVVEPAHHH